MEICGPISESGFKPEFYNPLYLSGYLTPLQRKKLREKRNLHFDEMLVVGMSETVKKQDSVKLKKIVKVPKKQHFKTKTTKERTPQLQYAASKIIHKPANSSEKHKKFFKTATINRLENVNFTMPLVFKKNVFLNIDKCVKKVRSIKAPLQKESSRHPLISFENVSKDTENSNQNFEVPSLVSEFTNCSTAKDESTKQVSDSPKEKSVFDFDWPSDEFLIRRQEKARAQKRKLNVLKKLDAEKQSNTIQDEESLNVQPVKLYPIFNNSVKKLSENNQSFQNVKSNPKRVAKLKMDKGEQMYIDAGQKEVGAKICSTCNMLYTIGQDEDEKLHSNYHNMYLINLKFTGWKEENIIGEYSDGRVLLIKKEDKRSKLKKMADILLIANRDLGFPSSSIPEKPDLTFVLFISSTKQVAGCLIAEPISNASEVLLMDNDQSEQKECLWRIGNWYSSSQTVPAICGVNRIWVAHSFRRQKVASRMIDCLRCHFIHGHVVGIRELAFTDPSTDGRAFAAAYTGTNHFLVYK